jgi:hypothetical protein
MSRANTDLMDAIHGMVASALKDELVRAMKAAVGPEPVPINPQLIDKAMKFLKDNGIDAPKANPKVDALAATLGALPDLDMDAEAVRLQ